MQSISSICRSNFLHQLWSHFFGDTEPQRQVVITWLVVHLKLRKPLTRETEDLLMAVWKIKMDLVKWNDNKSVPLFSSECAVEPENKAKHRT